MSGQSVADIERAEEARRVWQAADRALGGHPINCPLCYRTGCRTYEQQLLAERAAWADLMRALRGAS